MFLVFPATIEFIEEYKLLENIKDILPKIKLILKKWSWILLLPIGTCIYLYINYSITGDALYFLKMEEMNWHQTTQAFFQTIAGMWEAIGSSAYDLSFKMSTFIPGIIMLFAIYGIMLYGTRRHRSMYTVWLWVYLMVNTAMSWPISMPRYLICAVPIYIILGEICEKHKKVDTALTVTFSIMFGIFLTGYLMHKHIV